MLLTFFIVFFTFCLSELVDDVSLLLGLWQLLVVVDIFGRDFSRRLKGVADLELTLFIAVEIVPDHSVEIVVIVVDFLWTLLMLHLGRLDLERGFIFGRGPQYCGFIIVLILYNT